MDDIADIYAAMTGARLPDPRATQILVCDGTSLCLVNGVAPVAAAYASAWLDPNGVLMVEGLKASDGLAIALQGPQGGSYDTAAPATGYGPATFRGLQKRWASGSASPCAAGGRGLRCPTRAS